MFDTNITATNSIGAFTGLSVEDIAFAGDWNEEFLKTEESVGIVTDGYATLHGVAVGDEISFPTHVIQNDRGGGNFKWLAAGTAKTRPD